LTSGGRCSNGEIRSIGIQFGVWIRRINSAVTLCEIETSGSGEDLCDCRRRFREARADRPYRTGRSKDWVKMKNHVRMKDAFDQWWEWARKPLDSLLTIPAEIHNPVMALPENERRDREFGTPCPPAKRDRPCRAGCSKDLVKMKNRAHSAMERVKDSFS
jgi:hypothetical protein